MRTTNGTVTRRFESAYVKRLCFGVGCLAAISISTVQAQTASAPVVNEEQELAPVIVSANRRAENLQTVPIAVTAVSALDAENRGITDLETIANIVPGLTITRSLGDNIPFIRGVGSASLGASQEPSVATYVDNVYNPSGFQDTFDFNNIDHVEVLKGPQGTLFGRNATGGVIQVFTRDPTAAPEMDFNVGYANYDTKSGSFYGTAGLTQDLSANIALHASDQSKGWGTNIYTGDSIYKGYDFGARVKVLWTPGSDTRLLLSLDSATIRNDAGETRSLLPGTLAANGPNPPVASLPGFYNTNEDIDGSSISKSYTGSLKWDQGLGPVDFTSISAYQNYQSVVGWDLALAPIDAINVDLGPWNKAFTEELQLKSPKNSKVQWIAGAFYYWNAAGHDPENVTFGPSIVEAIAPRIDAKSLAGFAQGTMEILPATNLTLGIRYTDDKKSADGTITAGGHVIVNTSQSASWNKTTWRVALDHQFTESLMTYVSVNTGFKSGVYSETSFNLPPASPETLTAYEIGAKTDWFDHRLRLNASAFYYDYKDMQVSVTLSGPPPTSLVLNAGTAKVKGGDLDLTAIPIENLTLVGGLSILDGTYTKFLNGTHLSPAPLTTCGNPPFPPGSPGGMILVPSCDLSGNRMMFAPPFTANLGATYSIPGPAGKWNLNLSYSYTDKYYFQPDEYAFQNPLSLLNGSIDWAANSGIWDVKLWGRNLGDRKYYAYAQTSSFGAFYSAAAPITYGVTFYVHLK